MRLPDLPTPWPARAAQEEAIALREAVERALDAVLADQRPDGHWLYELEADATIPAEYVLMVHYLGEQADRALEARIARYLRRIQGADGGWPLLNGGPYDPSASVKAYFALKMTGDSPAAPHMARARMAIRAHGGAERCNVFTRILLALFGQVPWEAAPAMPVELVLLPRWSPFHLSKVSYWTRTVLVPLLVLAALRPRARNPRGVRIDELFLDSPQGLRMAPRAPHQGRLWFTLFRAVDAQLRRLEPVLARALRQRAIEAASAFVAERLNGQHGLGGIFPAMVNAALMFDALGQREQLATARGAIDRLLVERGAEAYCQPCLSPVWDTALMCHALLEEGSPRACAAAGRALVWLRPLQVLDPPGDWRVRRPRLRPGGWAFQYANPHYPDVDDTAVVAMAMDRAAALGHFDDAAAIARADEWVAGMQCRCGGWGAFEADNTQYYLNSIPFADHGALLDPPTADVSARCLSMLAQLHGAPRRRSHAARALAWLLAQQERDGSWYGRWGMNYVYGTWSALCALNAAGLRHDSMPVARALRWLAEVRNEDGGWGEDGSSYALDHVGYCGAPSTPSQTAWAVLGLMAGGAAGQEAATRGVRWLLEHQRADGLWDEPYHTATGFERVFYLRYHGYARYFPLWALARYRNLRQQGSRRVAFGM
ncbi:squalene--hopene cyclase [Massilia terrae]|uniref:Squalene--hopene cyclase n=1 Tax=Massilia terrae TaxID=1811224 RepID=A0ABT2CYX0_9BURK|nr:squalene--hopene cyclase [Massilia terrae]MCS0659172.1 squalene--hopene cyclase [Massilia terrae]